MSVLESNKLIAEFMGGIPTSTPNIIRLPQTIGESRILYVKGSGGLPSGTYKVERINELKYHKSWNWLMPVVDKCMRTGDNTHDWDALYDALSTVNKTCIHEAVVEFIKSYNENK